MVVHYLLEILNYIVTIHASIFENSSQKDLLFILVICFNKLKHIKFDLVFIDPPFKLKVIDELISYLINNDMIAEEGYIMAEYPKEDVVNKDYEGYSIKLCRNYSSSEVLILEKE